MTPLCKIAEKYGTDKCPQIKHVYTPYYYNIYKTITNDIRKVVEMGIGNYRDMKHVDVVFDKRLNRHYHRGAGLYMWREFFPNAEIYGADILPETIFKDERITTYLCDETNKDDVYKLLRQTGTDIDIFVDDGLHTKEAQVQLCKWVMGVADMGIQYYIEDVGFPDYITQHLSEFNCSVPRLEGRKHIKGHIVLVTHK